MAGSQRTGPKGADTDVRQALMAAGCALYEVHGLRGVSLRQVAEHAGVNPAMVRYYFKDKVGFELAMLDVGCQRLLSALPVGADLEATFRSAFTALNAMPWLPVLIMRTVHIGDSLREYFKETYVADFRARLERPVGGDAKFSFLTIMSLLVMPQLTRQLSSDLLGIEFDEEFAAAYAAHVKQLLEPE